MEKKLKWNHTFSHSMTQYIYFFCSNLLISVIAKSKFPPGNRFQHDLIFLINSPFFTLVLLLLLLLLFSGFWTTVAFTAWVACDFCANGEGKSAAACCGVGGFLCKNGWLKNTSNGIRSFAFRRNSPMRRFWSSGDVPTGILNCTNKIR